MLVDVVPDLVDAVVDHLTNGDAMRINHLIELTPPPRGEAAGRYPDCSPKGTVGTRNRVPATSIVVLFVTLLLKVLVVPEKEPEEGGLPEHPLVVTVPPSTFKDDALDAHGRKAKGRESRADAPGRDLLRRGTAQHPPVILLRIDLATNDSSRGKPDGRIRKVLTLIPRRMPADDSLLPLVLMIDPHAAFQDDHSSFFSIFWKNKKFGNQ